MTAQSWVEGVAESGFSIDCLPYGVATLADGTDAPVPMITVAIADQAVMLGRLAEDGLFDDALDHPTDVLGAESLDPLLALGPDAWQRVRARLKELLTDDRFEARVEPALAPISSLIMAMPFEVADYVDFYSSQQHAENIGRIFRPDSEPLTPNWKHLPIGYHGRAGTVVVSGTDVVRPCGQRKAPTDPAPVFGPSIRLDIEAEVGFVVGGPGTALGTPVPIEEARAHIFGVVLLNDWSARDIQAWEYVPLGPFLGKSFQTSISPWVVPLDALDTAMVSPPVQSPQPLPYLRQAQWGLDLTLEVRLNGQVVSRPPFRDMYWTPAQQLAHLTVNGASLRPGDLFASGTVSGSERDQRGSFIELTWNGAEPLTLADGSSRSFLRDGDTVTISATAPGPGGVPISLGEVTGTIRPARPARPPRPANAP